MGGWILRREDGFTLAEMMVTVMVMLLVLTALYAIFEMSITLFGFGSDRVEAIENARLGLERMEREIRAAYPVDGVNGLKHIFFVRADPTTPELPGERSLTFGNDLAHGTTPPNRRIVDSAAPFPTPDAREVITYELRRRGGGACPASGQGGVCTLQRITSSGSSPVVDHVAPGGLRFTYLDGDLQPATAADGTDIEVVRMGLKVDVNGRSQTLTTDVALRNGGG